MQHYIKYQTFQFSSYESAGTFFMLGLLINLAIPPFSYWSPKAYTSATALSTIVFTACSTKIVALLAMCFFPEVQLLVGIGAITVVYGILFALIEECSLRRLICYLMIAKIGFILIYIGYGER